MSDKKTARFRLQHCRGLPFSIKMSSMYYIFVLTLLPITVSSEDLHQEYYTDATMNCNETAYNFTSTEEIKSRYWLLPNGRLVDSTDNDDHMKINQTTNSLAIYRISDDDFGKYYCVLVRADFTLDHIEHGLNVDGPYYGDLLARYRKNAMYGGIAAACLFVVLAGSCILYHFRYHTRIARNKAVDALDKAIDGYDLKSYDNIALDEDVKANGAAADADEKF